MVNYGFNVRSIDLINQSTIYCNVYSREYKGNYYNQIEGWKFSKSGNEFVTTDDNDMPF